MKDPEYYIEFKDFEEQQKKYREWGFRNRKNNELKPLYYKGTFTDRPVDNPEECEIIGYTNYIANEMVVVIYLKSSKIKLSIDRRYLKHMQLKTFKLDQEENEVSEEQGRELMELPDNYIVYDLETTGLSTDEDEIIEIGALKVVNGKIVDHFQSLIKPQQDIPRKITKLTEITNLMVSNAPSISEILPDFMEFIGDSILIGHNIKSFDNVILRNAYKLCCLGKLGNDYIDTLTIARKLYPELSHHKIENLIEYLQLSSDRKQHRALNDCYYEYEIYERTKKYIIKKYGNIEKLMKSRSRSITKLFDNNVTKKSSKQKTFPTYTDLRTITTTNTEFDKNNPFYDKSCVFTGELEKYSREEAAHLIIDLGGKCENNVTKKTNYLIVSADSDPNKKSGKQKKAEEYKLKGLDIEIISENVFYDMINYD